MKKKSILKNLNKAYSDAIIYIAQVIVRNGFRWVKLDYGGLRQAFNVEDRTGETYPITAVEIDPRWGLIARSGKTEFPLGTDIDGQDNYTVAGIWNLMDAVEQAVQKVLDGLIHITGHSKEDIIEDIAEKFGNEPAVMFEGEFPLPVFATDEENHEIFVEGLAKDRLLLGYTEKDGSKVNIAINLSELSKKDVLFAVDTYNAYKKYLHNEAVNN